MEIQVTISDVNVSILENDLLDINQWVQNAVIGKINNCKKRMIAEWQPKLFADPTVENIPANEDDFINMVVARDDYKNMAQRREG